MPRTKGSRNKPKITTDIASQIAEKQESIASLTSEITSITTNINTLKAEESRTQGRPERADQAGGQESRSRSEGRRRSKEERSGKPCEKAAGRGCQC